MILQVNLRFERLLTNLTLERLVVRMRQDVHLKVSLAAKAPPTGRTNERFLPTVHHHVRFEAALAGEVLMADLALERLLVAMGSFMCGQCFSSSHLQSTHGTLMAQRLIVPLLVALKRHFVVEPLEAHQTFDGFVLVFVQRLLHFVNLVGCMGVCKQQFFRFERLIACLGATNPAVFVMDNLRNWRHDYLGGYNLLLSRVIMGMLSTTFLIYKPCRTLDATVDLRCFLHPSIVQFQGIWRRISPIANLANIRLGHVDSPLLDMLFSVNLQLLRTIEDQ